MVVGNLYNKKEFEIVKVDNKFYVLNLDKWNGITYSKCWEVADKYGFDQVGQTTYEITPVYNRINEDDFELLGYKVEKEM